jgi:hypothetical protein
MSLGESIALPMLASVIRNRSFHSIVLQSPLEYTVTNLVLYCSNVLAVC